MQPKTIFLVYGLGEGSWHGQQLTTELKNAGYMVVDNIYEAEIIITHSGGPYALPPGIQPQLVVFINPVYWPDKSWFTAFGQKVWRDFLFCYRTHRIGYFCRKTAMNLWYILTRVKHTATMAKNYNIRSFTDMLPECHIIVIRNKDDSWCAPTIAETIPRVKSFHELPGEHDDCWFDPGPYVDLLQSNTLTKG